MSEKIPAMKPFERIALAHIAQELLWDPGLIPLASFTARQRRSIMLMLRRMAVAGAAGAGEDAPSKDTAPDQSGGRRQFGSG